jgi:hypothetical protein
MAERDRRGITARIDRTNHVPVPINVIAPPGGIVRSRWNTLSGTPPRPMLLMTWATRGGDMRHSRRPSP